VTQEDFHVDQPSHTENAVPSDFFPADTTKLDLTVFVGPPGAGKTTFYKDHFASRGYQWVNQVSTIESLLVSFANVTLQDTLKSATKCLSMAKQHLLDHRSVVIDNTNRTKSIRSTYITLAKELNVNVRCVYFDASHELCVHNSLYRVRAGLVRLQRDEKTASRLLIQLLFFNSNHPKRKGQSCRNWPFSATFKMSSILPDKKALMQMSSQ
jgi:predicted kinase